MKMTLSEELEWRGLVYQTTFKDLKFIDENKLTFYHGFDASADSQTIGNLASMMMDLCFLRHGHKAIVLAGGATSLIGDAGGKDKERDLQAEEKIRYNVECAKKQLQKIYGKYEFTLVNNIDWTKGVDILDFLRDIGKFFNIGDMIKKDIVANRIGEGGSGISYTEFSYSLLQGYDFLHLFDTYNCTLQLCGADQWTNCIAGVELIRRKRDSEAHVLTNPLIINKATGKKFGKSEAGAVWLDSQKTSVYDFYQFWINVDDESVKDYLKIFTEINVEEYEKLIGEFEQDKSTRLAQKYLAYEVTKLVHGESEAENVKEKRAETLSATKWIENDLLNMVDFLVEAQILPSKREAREQIDSGAVSINEEKLKEKEYEIKVEKDFELKVGKKKMFNVTI